MAASIPVRLADGREFPSIAACSRATGIKRETLWWRLERGQFPFSYIQPKKSGCPPQKTYFRGKIYPSLTAAAKANNVSKSTVIYTLKKIRNG